MNIGRRAEELRLAVVLLTRLPVGRVAPPAPSFAQAAWAFPLVGVPVGLLSGAVYWTASSLGLPGLAAALLAIGAAVLATGAMHEDGLADVADGFGGGGEISRKLEIMRDSQVGTYGVVAVFLAIGLLAASIGSIGASWGVVYAFVAVAAISRAMMLVPMTFLPTARDDGLGSQAVLSGPGSLLAALAIAALVSLPVFITALVAIWVMGAVTFGVTVLARRQIGGQSGDVLGATQKLTEVAGWMVFAALS